MDNISPKYLMRLVSLVEKSIWKEFPSYREVRYYMEKWHEEDEYNWENFRIATKESGVIDLAETLHGIRGDLLLKIAIDMGVETPNFIPAVPIFKNELKLEYENAFQSFQQASKQVEENPDLAIGLANSTLEAIVKEILTDERIGVKGNPKHTLYDLTIGILKAFRLFPLESIPKEVKTGEGTLWERPGEGTPLGEAGRDPPPAPPRGRRGRVFAKRGWQFWW